MGADLTEKALAVIARLTDEQRRTILDDETVGWWGCDLEIAEYDESYDPESGEEFGYFSLTDLGRKVEEILKASESRHGEVTG